jgi:hypothetical protein
MSLSTSIKYFTKNDFGYKKWLFKFLMDNVQMDEINLKPNRQYFGKKKFSL